MAYTYLVSHTSNGKNIFGGTLSNYVYGIDVYIEQSNAAENYTNVKTIAWIRCDSGTTTSSTFYFKENNTNYQNTYIKLGVSDNSGNSVPMGHGYYANEKVTKYYHNDDGTKTITLNFSVESGYTQGANANLNNYCFKSAAISVSVTLPTIYRISSFSVGSFTMGAAGTITISRYSSSFTHTLSYSFGSASGTIATGASTSATWTPDKALGHQIPNATSGVGTITCYTYSGNALVGSTSKTFTLWISGDMYPTFTYNYTPYGVFHQNLITKFSSVGFDIRDAAGSYGSTIKSYSINGEGLNVNSSYGTSTIFTRSGTFTYTLKVTDSRNRTTTQTKSITVYWYEEPIVSLDVSRCNSNGVKTDIGNYATISINYSYSNPNNGNQNSNDIRVYYKESGSETWSLYTETSVDNYSGQKTIFNGTIIFGSSKSYDIKVLFYDTLSYTEVIGFIGTSKCVLDIEPNGVGVGKYHQQGELDVMGSMYLNDHRITTTDNGLLGFDDMGIAVTKTISFTPYFYSNDQTAANWTTTESVGRATYLGDLIFVQCRLLAQHDGSPNQNAQVAIGGLPERNVWSYPAISIGFFGGGTTNLNSNTGAIRGYIEAGGAFIRMTFDYRHDGNWQYLKSIHLRTGEINITFSAIYRWR